jgi:hypothetical protein
MQVYERRTLTTSTYIDVSGNLEHGYRICRQVIGADDEAETTWTLTADQSRQLLDALGSSVTSHSLEPTSAAALTFDRLLQDSLERVTPPPRPFTHWSFD